MWVGDVFVVCIDCIKYSFFCVLGSRKLICKRDATSLSCLCLMRLELKFRNCVIEFQVFWIILINIFINTNFLTCFVRKINCDKHAKTFFFNTSPSVYLLMSNSVIFNITKINCFFFSITFPDIDKSQPTGIAYSLPHYFTRNFHLWILSFRIPSFWYAKYFPRKSHSAHTHTRTVAAASLQLLHTFRSNRRLWMLKLFPRKRHRVSDDGSGN